VCYYTELAARLSDAPAAPNLTHLRNLMARACAICGKVSMGGFNPQSSGMNRVRAHRRYQPNLQPLAVTVGRETKRLLVCTRCRRTRSKSAA
jgi:large subunit ribosomal protein L28